MIVGEPYFSSTLLPWHNLYFWYVRTYANHLLKEKSKVIPFKAQIQAISGEKYVNVLISTLHFIFVVKFNDLHKLRSEISTVEGFNLSIYQTFIQQVEHPRLIC